MIVLTLPIRDSGSVNKKYQEQPKVCWVNDEIRGRKYHENDPQSLTVNSSPALYLFHKDYDVLHPDTRVIGEGASSIVWSARSRATEQMVAVKIISDCVYKYNESEVPNLQAAQEVDNVVQLIRSYHDDNHTILVMELCMGCDLQNWDYRHLRLILASLVHDIMRSVLGLHMIGIYHGDIRLENIIANYWSDSRLISIRIVDFGSSHASSQRGYLDVLGVARIVTEVANGERNDEDTSEWVCTAQELDSLDGLQRDFVSLLLSAKVDNHLDVLHAALEHPWCQPRG